MSKQLVTIPDLGGAHDVEVIEVPVAKGDVVEKDQTLVVLETDKASMDFPSPYAGRILAVKMKEGDTIAEGDVVVEMEVEGSGGDDKDAAQEEDKPAAGKEEPGGEAEKGRAPEPESETEPDAKSGSEPESEPETKQESVPEPEPKQESEPDTGDTDVAPVTLPDLGGADEVEVIEVSVSVGDTVAQDDTLVVLESDKASMEFPSPMAGTVIVLKVSEGDRVHEGDVIAEIRRRDDGEERPDKDAGHPAEETEAPAAENRRTEKAPRAAQREERSAPQAATRPSQQVYAGPAVRKTARELGVDLAQVPGSGPRGRIVKEDVQDYVRSRLGGSATAAGGAAIPAVPEVDFAEFGAIRVEKRSRIHRVTAENMHRSWLNVPHVTQFDDVDITDLEAFRKSLADEAAGQGVKLTLLPFLLRACAAMLKRHPLLNSSLHPDGESLVYKEYVHIGVAVDTPAGLVVPVVRDVDRKGLYELAAETADLADKARNRKLTPEQMRGGTFSISSLGPIGGSGFTPIVNTPEVAILGVSKMATKPVWDGTAFVPRSVLPLALSYDHRAVNGADAGRFVTDLGRVLADIRRLVV